MQALRLAQASPLAHFRLVDQSALLRGNTLWRGAFVLRYKQRQVLVESANDLSLIRLDTAQRAQLALAHWAAQLATRTEREAKLRRRLPEPRGLVHGRPLPPLPGSARPPSWLAWLPPSYACRIRVEQAWHRCLELSIAMDGIALAPLYVMPFAWKWRAGCWTNLCAPWGSMRPAHRATLHLDPQRVCLVRIDVAVRPGDSAERAREHTVHSFVDPRLLRCILDALCAADPHLPFRTCRP